MRSKVADEARERQRADEAALTIEERLALLARANDLATHLLAAADGITIDEARRKLAADSTAES